MRLPRKQPSTQFINASGSNVAPEFALHARAHPSDILEMAETPEETAMLKREALARQYVLLIDRSGSMKAPDSANPSQTRWQSAELACGMLINAVFQYDIDHTIPVYLFGQDVQAIGEMTSPAQVQTLFREYQPGGTTNLLGALQAALGDYIGTNRQNYETVPGTTFIVLTDGAPDDPHGVVNYMKHVTTLSNGIIKNHEELAISFVQMGDDPDASSFLKYLDDSFVPDVIDYKKDDILRQPGGVDKLLFDAIFD